MTDNQKKIIIFHVFPDDKFFDSTADFYDSLSGVENRYFYFTKEKHCQLKYIKKTDRLTMVNNKWQYVKELRRDDVDIVLFHSLKGHNYSLIRLVKQNVKVIWWSWGNDIYMGRYNIAPLINISLYKPLTLDCRNKLMPQRCSLLSDFKALLYKYMRKNAIGRVDFFIPSIPVDYELMKEQCPFFAAKLFPYGMLKQDYTFQFRPQCGNLLVGNSLTYSNNHLDVFEVLYGIELPEKMKVVVPVSYGNEYGGVDSFIAMTHFGKDNVLWLKDFLSRDEYFSIFDNISHAVFGMMRQQGMGNILYCLRTGVKVFLYKDSVIARQLKNCGYIFFTIENDLNAYSLSECLTEKEARHNYNVYLKRYDGRQLEDIQNKLEEIIKGL